MAVTEKYIDPFTDYGFKRLFGSEPNKDLLIDFLNQLLPPEHRIQELTFTRTEKTGRTEFDRRAIFDLSCLGQNGERFIVEMQRAKQDYFKDRTVFYASFPIQEQAQRGDWNYRLEPIYLVGILDFVFAEDKDNPEVCQRVQLKDQNHRVFYDKLTFIYLEMPKFTKTEDELETPFDKWLYVLRHLPRLDERPAKLQERIFKHLFDEAEVAKYNRDELALYEESLKVYRDNKNTFDYAIREAEVKAEARGEARGEAKGRAEGRAEGLVEGRIETARKALRQDLPLAQIADLTGLTKAEIEALRE